MTNPSVDAAGSSDPTTSATSPGSDPDASPVLQRLWWALLALGVLTIGFGIAVLVWPVATLAVAAVLFGLWLLTAGVVRLVWSLLSSQLSFGWRLVNIVLGILLIGAGIGSLTNLVRSLATLVFVMGFFIVVDGVGDLLQAIGNQTDASRGWLVFTGLVGIIAGGVILSRPGVGLVALVLVTGWMLILVGVGRIVAALALRRLATAA